MKIVRKILFFILIVGVIHGTLSPKIPGRVSGIVREYSTGQALKDVNVTLVTPHKGFHEPLETALTKTNEFGYFEFNDVYKGKYFVKCEKPGHMTVNPIYLAQEQNPEDYLPFFLIDEGQIAHLEIKMKRGGSLKVTIQKKDANGIFGISEAQCWVSKQSKSIDPETGDPFLISVASPFTDKNGVAFFNGLEPEEEYSVTIYEPGLPYRKKKTIIRVNETIELNFLFDLTDKTGIRGEISYNENKTPEFTSVGLRLVLDGKYNYVTDLDVTGESDFLITNLTPGTYLLRIANSYEGDDKIERKRILLDIKKDETTFVKISF